MGRAPDLAACSVLVVDDESANLRLLTRLLRDLLTVEVATTTDPAAAVLACSRSAPDLLLLDLHMPGLDGIGVLEALAEQRSGDGHFPVLILTGDGSSAARRRALAAGADDFLPKPFDAIEVRLRVEHLLQSHIMRRLLSDDRRHLRTLVAEQLVEIERTRAEVLDRLALASEYRDDETHRHARRIGSLSRSLAERLGCDRDSAELLGRAAPLHDIGKLGIPDAILLKPGRLTEAEFRAMQRHTTIGARILGGSRTELLRVAEQIAATHHERWDGSGYPARLAGTETPLPGRIVAVADVYDALSHKRPYKDAWPADEARSWVVDRRGSLFDPDVVEAFEAVESTDDGSLAGVAP